MASITVEAHLADGGLAPFSGGLELLKKYRVLEAQGLRGRALIHRLLTDDWAAPPRAVLISGTDENGKSVHITIPYR